MPQIESLILVKRLPDRQTRRALRLAAGLSLDELGEIIGVTRSAGLWATAGFQSSRAGEGPRQEP